jgi:D-amino-acid dehydrogenase
MKSIVVIGGGVIGLCTAYFAVQRGHSVTVLERESEDHAGCSHGNAGMITPSHFIPLAAPGAVALGLKWMRNPESPFWVKPRWSWELFDWAFRFWRASNPMHVERSAPLLRDLHLASRALFEELAQFSGNDFGLVQKGLLMLCKTEHALEEEARIAETARKLDLPAEVLDSKGAAALDPDIQMDIAGAVYFPKDCHLSPSRFMSVLRQILAKKGVAIGYDTEVTRWQRSGSTIEQVITTKGNFRADEFVLSGGSWSTLLARELNLSIPMQAGKGYSLTLENPRQLPKICAIFTEARVAVTPMGKTLRFGGTMEIAGLNEEINPVRVQGIIKSVPRYYPAFQAEDFAGVPAWRGLRPCSPDGLPYIGRTGPYRNLSIATGHAMMGLSLGPITGKLITDIISGEPCSIDIRLLNPDRYA